jgi:phosphate transport system substrate-binding protein
MTRFSRFILCSFSMIALLIALSGCGPAVNEDYAATATGGSYIQNKGSDTIVNLALAWAERYQQEHPEVRISVTGGGTGTGIASLINGTVDIANASRTIKKEEIAEAQQQGIDPQEHVIARDAIAVIVNPNNPVQKLTLEQVSEIYRGEINNWKEVGGEDRPIVRVSRETNSGTHVYFLESVIRMGKKDSKVIFAEDTLLLPSSEGIISEVGDNPSAIGYDGLGYVTPQVKVISIAEKPNGDYIQPSAETVNNGKYPISRELYMYTGNQPNAAIQAYLNWILTPEAQEIVTDLGFVPVKK